MSQQDPVSDPQDQMAFERAKEGAPTLGDVRQSPGAISFGLVALVLIGAGAYIMARGVATIDVVTLTIGVGVFVCGLAVLDIASCEVEMRDCWMCRMETRRWLAEHEHAAELNLEADRE